MKANLHISNEKNRKVILGLSGGVDSTAAALLLMEQGYEVTGLYFDVFRENRAGLEKAARVAEELGIRLITKNVCDLFEQTVIQDFINEYSCGRTPNPCVLCNPEVKFRTLIEAADEEGAAYIATGHYAKTGWSERQQCWTVKMADNLKKDQSYMLYRLPSQWVKRLILPLSDIDDKEKTRELARSMSMSNAEDRDSQEICFLENGMSYVEFLKSRGVSEKPGYFIDREGNILGESRGIINYTVGQRKGLGIALGKPAFVVALNDDNNVVLGDNDDLFSESVICESFVTSAGGRKAVPESMYDTELRGKIRYASKPSPCRLVRRDDDRIEVVFSTPQRAATPGQSLVLYLDDEVAGGGVISAEQKSVSRLKQNENHSFL